MRFFLLTLTFCYQPELKCAIGGYARIGCITRLAVSSNVESVLLRGSRLLVLALDRAR